jgi:maintenance of morphology protein 1
MNVLISPHVAPSAWTFTQGFLVGQVCFIVLCLLFVRYVVFSPAEKDDGEAWRRRRAERAKVSAERRGVEKKKEDGNRLMLTLLQKSLLSTTAVPPPPTARLLNMTGYDMATHPAESASWVNVLFAQVRCDRDALLTTGAPGISERPALVERRGGCAEAV